MFRGIEVKPENEIDRLRKIVQGLIPALDLLQDRLERGEYLAQQDGLWHLFDVNGEGVVSGPTLRDLLINLIFFDC